MLPTLVFSLIAALNNDAVRAYLNNDFAGAEALYRKALAATNCSAADRAKVHSNLGALYKRQQRLALAADQYMQAVRLTGFQNGVAVNNLAEMRRLQGRTSEAVRLFRKAVAILEPVNSPDLPAVLHNLGAAEAERGHFAAARQHLWKAIALRQEHQGESMEIERTARLLAQLDTVPVPELKQVDYTNEGRVRDGNDWGGGKRR